MLCAINDERTSSKTKTNNNKKEKTPPSSNPGLPEMQCCLTLALRCRLNTMLCLIQSLLKFMGKKNPLFLTGFESLPGRQLSAIESSACFLVHLCFPWRTPIQTAEAQSCSAPWDPKRSKPEVEQLSRHEWTRGTSHSAIAVQGDFLWETFSVLHRWWP